MPRDGSGDYTLAAGNPVAADTLILDTWANPTMDDLAFAMTDSLSRSGLGGMLAPFLNADGAINLPGISWSNEPASGWYRAGAGDFRYSIGGVDVLRINAGNLFLWSGTQWDPFVVAGGAGSVPDGSAESQTLRWDDTGEVWVVNGNFLVDAAGNVAANSISFDAGANTLANYAEGTFTPVLSDGTNTDATYSAQAGFYTRIGNRVLIDIKITLTSLGSLSGILQIDGLPFPMSTGGDATGSITVGFADMLNIVAGQVVSGRIDPSQSFIQLGIWSATTGQTNFNSTQMSANGELTIACQYRTQS